MSKEQSVINYYIMCNRLKNVIRTGWKKWNVQRERIESVAEHIFGVQMLAIAMKSEYQYDVDILKVVFMLAIHELGETVIGDLTQFQISKGEKEKIEHVPINIQNIIEKEQKYIAKMEQEISKMKKDSIALINQITTISKQRIFKDTVRRNVKISSESLNLIDKQIIKFFTK